MDDNRMGMLTKLYMQLLGPSAPSFGSGPQIAPRQAGMMPQGMPPALVGGMRPQPAGGMPMPMPMPQAGPNPSVFAPGATGAPGVQANPGRSWASPLGNLFARYGGAGVGPVM